MNISYKSENSAIPLAATNSAQLNELLHANLEVHEYLGQTLLRRKLIRPEILREALKIQKTALDKKLGDILIEIGATTKSAIQKALMEEANLPSVHLEEFDIDPKATELISANLAQELQVMPLMFYNDKVVFAVSEVPDRQARDLLRFTIQHALLFATASQEDIELMIQRSYSLFSNAKELASLELASSESENEQHIWSNADQLAKQGPLVKLVDSIIRDAIGQHASDIHFRPSETEFELLYRIDGTLVGIRKLKSGLFPAIVSRIKIMAKLNIAEHRLPQDGRIKINDEKFNVDLRVSIIPMQFGESIVIRILNKSQGLRSIGEIGFSAIDQEKLNDLIHRSYGIILVTGPTGSGKSTTLYAALQEITKEKCNIITVEDPIEYELANVRQIQLISQINFGFPQALRHILRHDPDVIMIGEMRDLETCKIAVESALTGHLVLSTLHTNDAPGALVRLMEIGIAPYMIQSAVIGVLAQRLVRLNCTECLVEETISATVRKNLNLTEDEHFYCGSGCHHCHNTGFKGRMAIYELLVMNDELRDHVQIGVASDTFRTIAIKNGMTTLPVHGIQQARKKLVSIAEVYRSCM